MTFLYQDWFLIALVVATLLVLLLLLIVVSAALRGGGAGGSGVAAKTLRLLGVQSLHRSFSKAVKLVEANLASGAERYNLSWTLLLDSGAGVPLREAGIASALAADSRLDESAQGIAWHFFDKGLVVQLGTAYLGGADTLDAASGKADGVWDEFLELCRHYRPQRPFDAIVLAVPAAALFALDAQGELAVVAHAQALHRRLWLAQNRLALRFPVHVVVSECEAIPGFARFGAALPAPVRRTILGWASPHALAAPFRDQWIDTAMDQVVGAVADACAELCALEPGESNSLDYFLLPAEMERLRSGLKLFCAELMRPNAYHESFLLRGVYLTGDTGAGAVLQAAPAGAGGQLATPAAGEQTGRQPAFLRDIFERKVFAEVGIVQATRQRLRRPAMRWLGKAALALPVLVWGGGLIGAGWRLGQDQQTAVDWLDEVVRVQATGAAPRSADALPSRQALEKVSKVAAIGFWSVAMPGSWFRGLDQDLHKALAATFGKQVVVALHQAAREQARSLIGDGVLPCALPAGWPADATRATAGIDLNALPEYRSMQVYLGHLLDYNKALAAMTRLHGGGTAPADPADLALAADILLEWKVPPIFDGAAAIYRKADLPLLDLLPGSPLDQNACILEAAGKSMYAHLFQDNPLLVAEQRIGTALAALRAPGAGDAAARLAPWQALQRALADEQALLAQAPGQGAWMQQQVDLIPGQEPLLRRVRFIRQLGDKAAERLETNAANGFAGFQNDWAAALAGAADDTGKGLALSGKTWVFTKSRQQLADGIAALLAPSYMQNPIAAGWPPVLGGQTIRWDKVKLDHAASLFDARKAFMAGPLTTLPPSLQASAGATVDALLAVAVDDMLAQAMAVSDAALPSRETDANRASVVAIRTSLQEIGATALGNKIDAVLRQDAETRLVRLNAVLDAAGVYLPRDATFAQWDGQKGVLFDAFGAGDLAGLNLYLDQQKEFVDTIDAQAGGVLTLLASTAPAGAMATPLVAAWQDLHTDVVRYGQKSPASSRLALENFMRTASTEIDLTNCFDKLGKRAAARTAPDLFARRLRELQDGILNRCRVLAVNGDQRQWRQFAEAWNRDVGAHAPFAVLPGEGAVLADRAAVGDVLKLYDSAQAAGALAGAPPRQYDPELRRLRALLAPLYPGDDTQAAALAVAVDFRVNVAAERNAAQIIDWTLTIGEASVHATDKKKTLSWTPGDAVALVLRVAKSGGKVPAWKARQPGMSVDSRSVTYRFDDPWALFSFIKAYQRPDTPGDEARGPVLGFAFGLAPAPDAPAGTTTDEALAFLRLRLSAPGKQAVLPWPASLPAALPLTNDSPKAAL